MPQRIFLVSLFFLPSSLFAQGHIDHIKSQEYLKLAASANCNNPDEDNLTQRICANVAFQKSDSLLTLIYNELLKIANADNNKSLKNKVVQLQLTWRKFRDQHCSIVYDQYKDCGGCHAQAIAYLTCLKEMTDDRIKELELLRETRVPKLLMKCDY